jgi:hypothetical protein
MTCDNRNTYYNNITNIYKKREHLMYVDDEEIISLVCSYKAVSNS